ncbi:MAG TPA: cytochrome c peroxidase [Planctomycetota bacterium]|nr:cytochrome c peroxidase [Planctomycetota bacterium]
MREAALAAGLGPLGSIPVPEPPNLSQFLKPGEGARKAAIALGKAFFWDMQVGSDGQACGSCHFHAGADRRSKNQLSPGLRNVDPLLQTVFDPCGSGETGGPNFELAAEDFPFHALKDPEEENFLLREVLFDTDDVASSQGVFGAAFAGITPGVPGDVGAPFADPVFQVGGSNVRRVEPRNTPTIVNAVFNFANFWDGRAHNVFNGASVIGPLDPAAIVLVKEGGSLVATQVEIPNSSLASQAVGPPRSDLEMSFFDRPFPDIARKLFSLTPLGLQVVHEDDSVLGTYSQAPEPGLSKSYPDLIKKAFRSKYWNSNQLTNGTTQMEVNFPLFFGLAVQMYESTLVSDQSPFDAFMEGDDGALKEEQLLGLLAFLRTPESTDPVFTAEVGIGNCVSCHGGPEFTDAAFTALAEGEEVELIELEEMPDLLGGLLSVGSATAFLDNGFSNIGVRATPEDLGRGGLENGLPLSFARQALMGLPFAPDLPGCGGAGELPCPLADRVAVDGAFKIPGLRNAELTGPYFHNGGQATLGQVIEFYDRQGDFGDFNLANLDRNIAQIDIGELDEDPLVEFLLSLTDERVRNEMAPFDHPQIFVPNGHPGDHTVLECLNGGQACDALLEVPAVGEGGRPAEGLPPLGTFLGLPPAD